MSEYKRTYSIKRTINSKGNFNGFKNDLKRLIKITCHYKGIQTKINTGPVPCDINSDNTLYEIGNKKKTLPNFSNISECYRFVTVTKMSGSLINDPKARRQNKMTRSRTQKMNQEIYPC